MKDADVVALIRDNIELTICLTSSDTSNPIFYILCEATGSVSFLKTAHLSFE